jgi:hypothetical protein
VLPSVGITIIRSSKLYFQPLVYIHMWILHRFLVRAPRDYPFRSFLLKPCKRTEREILVTLSALKALLTFILLMWRIGRAPNSIPIYSYIQQDATSHNLCISGNCSTCFGWYVHPSSGAHTTVSTASGICHTVTAI